MGDLADGLRTRMVNVYLCACVSEWRSQKAMVWLLSYLPCSQRLKGTSVPYNTIPPHLGLLIAITFIGVALVI